MSLLSWRYRESRLIEKTHLGWLLKPPIEVGIGAFACRCHSSSSSSMSRFYLPDLQSATLAPRRLVTKGDARV